VAEATNSNRVTFKIGNGASFTDREMLEEAKGALSNQSIADTSGAPVPLAEGTGAASRAPE